MPSVNYGAFSQSEFQKILKYRKVPKPKWYKLETRQGDEIVAVKESNEISDEFEAWLIVLPDGIKSQIISTINTIIADMQAWQCKNATQIKNNDSFVKQFESEESARTTWLTAFDTLYETMTPSENKRISEIDDLFRYMRYAQEEKQEKRRQTRFYINTFNLESDRLKKLRGIRKQRTQQLLTWAKVIQLYIGTGGSSSGVGGTMSRFNNFLNSPKKSGGLFKTLKDALGSTGLNMSTVGTVAGFMIGGPVGAQIGAAIGGAMGGEQNSGTTNGLSSAFGGGNIGNLATMAATAYMGGGGGMAGLAADAVGGGNSGSLASTALNAYTEGATNGLTTDSGLTGMAANAVSGTGGFGGLGEGVTGEMTGKTIDQFLTGSNGDMGSFIGNTLQQNPSSVGNAVFQNYGSQANQLLSPQANNLISQEVTNANLMPSSKMGTSDIGKFASDLATTNIVQAVPINMSSMPSFNSLMTGL